MLVVTTMLSGCITITSHLFTVRKQLCEFDEYFSVSLERGLEVKLNEPVLLEREVFLMVGAAPTSKVVTVDGMTASYIFEQVQTIRQRLRRFQRFKTTPPGALCCLQVPGSQFSDRVGCRS